MYFIHVFYHTAVKIVIFVVGLVRSMAIIIMAKVLSEAAGRC